MKKVECRYGNLFIIENDTIISKSLQQYGEWAEKEVDLFKIFVETSDCVLDIGAFIGTHTIALAKLVGSSGKVFSFEPRPEVFYVLQKNIAENAPGIVKSFNFGLAANNQQLVVSTIDASVNMNYGGMSVLEDVPSSTEFEIKIELKKLDSIGDFPPVKLIKIDVEGMEHEVIKGAKNLILRDKPILYLECNNVENSSFALDFAKENGYAIYGYIFQAFNSANFNNNRMNFFGDAKEMGLILIPTDLVYKYENEILNLGAVAISTLDDLVLLLLHVPQYTCEYLTTLGSTSVVGGEFKSLLSNRLLSYVNEVEIQLARLRDDIICLKASREYRIGLHIVSLAKKFVKIFR